MEWSLVGRSNLGGCQHDTRALEISYSNLSHRAISTKISGSLEGRKKKKARISRSKSSVVIENRIDFLLEVGLGVGVEGTMGNVTMAFGRRIFCC